MTKDARAIADPASDRAGPESEVPEPMDAREEELVRLRRENEDLLRRLKYLQADFENYRKRSERDMESVGKFAHEVLVARLLPVLDELDAAVDALRDEAAEGVRLIRDNLRKTLEEAGLHEIPGAGEPFDPYVHDCVQQVPEANLKDGVVKEVVQKGYRLHDRVLRPAQVIVVKNGGETDA